MAAQAWKVALHEREYWGASALEGSGADLQSNLDGGEGHKCS